MSESVYEPDDAGLANDEAVDLDQAFGDEDVESVYETSYSPPDHEPSNTRFGTTWAEENQGETLDQRLAQEIPDPSLDADVETDAEGDDINEVDEVATDVLDADALDYGEVGDRRAGRLVDPDEGVREDEEKDLIGDDVGIDAGAASAEEAAVHIIDE
jgi:Family of unknown function (DUF5709)